MTSVLSTEGLESAISAIVNCKHDIKKAASGQELQKHARDGLGALLHLHMQYIEQCKASTSASKLVAEQKTSYQKSLLALQNKRVEKLFYERMINANRDFSSKIGVEDVDLAPEQDSTQQGATVAPDVAHENMKRRLQDEYTQREALQKDKVALEARSHELQNEVKAKRHKLDSAKGLMEQVSAAAKPAFRHLRLGALDWADTANTAMFPQLPSKLQALYFQIATATGFSSVDAQVYIEQARKRKGAGQVVLSMNVKGAKLTVIFGLVQDIDIVTARCSDKDKSQYVLEALYPDDPGDSWPSGKQPAQDLQHCMARPYRWCQHIVRAPDVASGEQSSLQRTVEFLNLLQRRCLDLTSLWSHLQALTSGKAPSSSVDDDAVHGPEASISRWKEVQGITVAPLQQVRKDGPKEEGELEECDKDTGPAQTDLSIRHEGVLEVAGIPAFAVGLKVSLYYPYVFPDFRITPLEGVYVPCEQLSSIEAETNALLPLEAPHDPLPAQFNYLCRMLHAMLAGQGAPQAASPISSSLRGNFVSRGRIGLSRADPVHQIDHAIHV